MLVPGSSAARFFSALLILCLSAAVRLVLFDLLYMMLDRLPEPFKKRGPWLLLLVVLLSLLAPALLLLLVPKAVPGIT